MAYAQRLQAIAQAGLAYSKDKYDLERFQEIRDISVEILSRHTDISYQKVKDVFAGESGYATPKVDVRAVVISNEQILLVQEQLDNKWSLPGGWADVHLSVKENLIKEASEEAGADIIPERLIALLDRKIHNAPALPFGIYKIFVACSLKSMNFQPNTETADARFFSETDLPPLSETRNTREQIAMCFDAFRTTNWQPLFD